MKNNLGTDYLFQCRRNYNSGIRPSNHYNFENEGYKRLVEIAQEYFKNGKKYEFLRFFEEYQYSVNLWTAHLVLEYGEPNEKEESRALEIIKRYSETPLNTVLATEEKNWLSNYFSNEDN